MKVFKISNIEDLKKDDKFRVAALGFFDGLHIAHKEIITRTVNKSKDDKSLSTVITFNISPKEYFSKKEIELLTPECRKKEILDDLGVDELYFLEFNEKLSKITKEEFIEKILKVLNIKELFCGYDYLFGYRGEGTPEYISIYTNEEIKVNKISKIEFNDEKISTTLLKEKVIEGNFDDYIKLSGQPYTMVGTVVKGKQLGRTINFPTANLEPKYNYLLPGKLGVYITKVTVADKKFVGITNIGKNPTVTNEDKIFIETHILDFNEYIYGEEIKLDFYKFIRSEKKFNGIDELKIQLEEDKKIAEKFVFKS